MTNDSTFTNTENTRIYKNHYGWTGETHLKLNGKNWVLTTMKRYNGKIATNCKVVEDKGGGSYSYMMFGGDPKEDFWLNELPTNTKATEQTIRNAHLKALAEFDAKNEGGELPKEDYKIEVGQVIFTDWINGGEENKRAIYAIEDGRFGRSYKTVLLDGSQTRFDDHIRPYSQKFGIGTYYNEGDKISQEEIDNLLIEAARNMELQAAQDAAQKIINDAAAEEKRNYLSQFIRADRRTTTNILKRHIFKTWPQVSDVKVRTDVFSMGDSMDVDYYAAAEIPELEKFVDNFQEGHFNGMEDIYEYSDNKVEIILEGHILQNYKYVFCKFKPESEEQAKSRILREEHPNIEADEKAELKATEGLTFVDYSEKAFAIIGNTKPIKEQLKELGGRFNANLSCGAGWIFPKTREEKVRSTLNLK